MYRFLIRRFVAAIITLLVVTLLVFILSRAQGDPRTIMMSDDTTQEEYDAWGVEFGLDKPLAVQYGIYLGKLLRGDFGKSVLQRAEVIELIWSRLPNSAQLAALALIFSIGVGVPLGIVAALDRGGMWDYLSRGFAVIGHSAPSFWTGLVFIYIFAVMLGWLPTSRKSGWDSMILPAVTLGWSAAGGQLRLAWVGSSRDMVCEQF